MAPKTSVLVIFEHDLLGEGIAARLHALGVHALTARSCDSDAVAAALHTHPDVVVVECNNEGCLARVRSLSPSSRVVDATPSVGRGYPTEAMRFDVILEALQSDQSDQSDRADPPRLTPA
jgi:DNA-binding NarL/FixJ family response regulator